MDDDGKLGHIENFKDNFPTLLKYCWSWHELYTNQRLITFRFHFLFVGSYIAAYYFLLSAKEYFWLTGLSIGSLFFNNCFWKLERRNINLIEIGENALILIENNLKKMTKHPDLMIADIGRKSGEALRLKSSYVVKQIFLWTSIIMGAGIVFPLFLFLRN